MLSQMHLENFKAIKNIDISLAPLTILSGLNGSGKSSILQAIGVLRQSYTNASVGLQLNGNIVQLGVGSDVLKEGAENDTIVMSIKTDIPPTDNSWVCRSVPDSSLLEFDTAPTNTPSFITSSDFQFLQADRIVPKTLYPQASAWARFEGSLGIHGEFTVDYLARNGSLQISKKRLAPLLDDGLNTNILSKAAPTEGLLDQVVGWMQHLSPGARITSELLKGTDEALLRYNYVGLKQDSKSNDYRPTNVGFGLTYSLPIIVACLATRANGLLLLENPEAHLHPKGQAALGGLLARVASDGVQVLVETHSDHLLNGIRLAVKNKIIKNNEVALHFCTRQLADGDTYIESPAILENGRLSNWPKDFFDQWDRSIEALLG